MNAYLDTAQGSLRAFTGDTSLSVDLLCVGDAEVAEWVGVSPVERLSEWWFQFAKIFIFDNEDTLLQPKRIVRQFDQLARERALSGQGVTIAQEAGIRALAAYPVRAISKNQADRPAFVLLALASQETAFSDQLACQILSETVSLLEIVIQIGWRDEIFELRHGSDEGTS
ncbi:MAG TPA: hypothetical protein VMY37_24105 [Thermoguttaceae bacterium]|nr:hypothetical protein [Thermoguttaceae bacterium]